jgi:transcriptional regulator with GAF, ATPase, and Fis domain
VPRGRGIATYARGCLKFLSCTVTLPAGDTIRRTHLASLMEAAPQLDLDVPRTSEDLKRVKKAARAKSMSAIERRFVLEALKRNTWNVTRSAEQTGMQRANFRALMRKHAVRTHGSESEGRKSGAA